MWCKQMVGCLRALAGAGPHGSLVFASTDVKSGLRHCLVLAPILQLLWGSGPQIIYLQLLGPLPFSFEVVDGLFQGECLSTVFCLPLREQFWCLQGLRLR